MSRRPMLRWASFKGLVAIILFLVIAALLEYTIVVYAVSLGVKEENLLKGSFYFPWMGVTVTIVVSPLFHLVPFSVIIALVFSWICMTKYAAIKLQKPPEGKPKTKPQKKEQTQKMDSKLANRISGAVKSFFSRIKSGLLRVRGVSYIWSKVSFAEATIKSATITILVFSTLILLVSVVAHPGLIYETFSNTYHRNPSLLAFVKSVNNALKSFVEVVGPIEWLCSAIDGAIVSAAPTLRGFVSDLGRFVKPLVDLPPACKYLFFQNAAAWASALTVFSYAFLKRKSYRSKRAKRS